MTPDLQNHVDVAADVREALRANRPVVALESALIAHGMPYPQNVSTARSAQAVVRKAGAVPATVAVIGGRIKVGLDDDLIEWLGTASGVLKLNRADLAHAVAARKHGATTVAATMFCARLAGIAVFATGGIGGVHRGAEASFDISADIEELVRTPVAVVCAGAKAILDIPKTLELLETRGVPVVGYRTDTFPAFWSHSSGLPVAVRLDTPELVAAMIRTQAELGIGGGVLIANPIPAESEVVEEDIARHFEAALAEAAARGVTGKAVTPFLLDRVAVTSEGRSLAANIALIENNARLAAEIATALTAPPRQDD